MTNKIVVLEGCDGAGKSTFADNLETLSRQQGWDVWRMHFGVPDESIPVVETHIAPVARWLGDAEVKGGNNLLIIDRYHIGEIVYGYMLRDGVRMTPEDHEEIDAFLAEHDAIKFYVRPSLETVLARFTARGDDLIKREQIVGIYELYDKTLLNDDSWTVAGAGVLDAVHMIATGAADASA